MDNNIAIEFDGVGKQYRLGLVGTGSLQHDLNRWWQTSILHKEDPYLKIGEVNDRSKKGKSDYVWALKDISFKVELGDVVGIIGKNGAGKSTLLKLLSHITAPSVGDIRYRGRIASLLEVGTGFHPEMTARQNIYMNGSIMGMTRHEITSKLDEIVDFAGIERYLDTPVKRFSSGMTVRLGFAVAAFLEPEILVVDEVLAVGDAEFQKKAIGKMREVSSSGGRTVLFVSHNMAAVRNLCRNGIVLKNGMLDYSGTAEECVDYYLGQNIDVLKSASQKHELIRRYDTARDVEIIGVRMLNESLHIACNEPIIVEIDVKKNRPVEEMSIEMMIDNQLDQRVGSYISKKYSILDKNDQFTIRLELRNHNLALGKYNLNFNIGLKDIELGMKDFDVVYEALSFEVDKSDFNTQMPIVMWRREWGSACFQDADVTFI
jgi:ABC-type polysaccharide/polyol phosphate transport system ATPase subunit